MVAINGLIKEWDISIIIVLLIVIVSISVVSYYTTIYLGDRISGFLSKVSYSRISIAVLIFLTLIVILFTGWFGFLVFLIATPTGMISYFAKIRKTHAMGVILLPVIMYFF